MDLGLPPFPSTNECVSVAFDEEPSGFEFLSDDASATPNPFLDTECCGIRFFCTAGSECPAQNIGPYDSGTLFQFLLKDETGLPRRLAPGESLRFGMPYGATVGKEAGMEAMVAVNAEIASFAFIV